MIAIADRFFALKSVQANGASEAAWALHHHALNAHQQSMQQLPHMLVQQSASSIHFTVSENLGPFALAHAATCQ